MSAAHTWEEANQICLMAELAEVRARLEKLLARPKVPDAPGAAVPPVTPEEVRSTMTTPPALETLCATFGLTPFERQILLMCAGAELDSRFASLYLAANKETRSTLPTFSLALAAGENAHWSALLPGHSLRYWRLIEVQQGEALTSSPLRIDEPILHFLAGMRSLDERLRGLAEPVREASEVSASQRVLADDLATIWAQAGAHSSPHWPALQLCGCDTASRRALAAAACSGLGLRLYVMPAHAAPHGLSEIELFIRLWEREVALVPSALLLEYDDEQTPDSPAHASLKRLVETLCSPLLVSSPEQLKPFERRLLRFEVPQSSTAEQLAVWKQALGAEAAALDGRVENLVSQFSLTPQQIQDVVARVSATPGAEPDPQPPSAGSKGDATSSRDPARGKDSADRMAAALWDACRAQVRPRLEGLAERLRSTATWDQLVLPEPHIQLLRQIALHVRQRGKVYETWGFASRSSRGLGISALFAGPSGTGKTMAGEVLANELHLDLFRIDLSQVVSKYIGETEKNLRRVFDAAEGGAAILLFDEADALFGKRSEVKDSHDRYANIEVGYLLQRMEAYRGLAILTTNRKEALDTAFLRRIRFVVEFPFPQVAERMEIWKRIFPRETPTEGLRVDRLARLGAAGGNIHNIALGAAFLAAGAGEPVRMSHLLTAARHEFTKIERPLTEAETAGWVESSRH